MCVAGSLVAACAPAKPARGAPRTSATTGVAPVSTGATSTTGPPPSRHKHKRSGTPRPGKPTVRLDDGSLGDRATRIACTLLSRAEIRAEFRAPVGAPTPAYPYCQWLVGDDAFLGLAVEPGVSYGTATEYVAPLVRLHGIGRAAEIANNRYLYFSAGGTSYWLLWQQVGDFSSLHSGQLKALAHDALAHGLPAGKVELPVPGPRGPPIYFAGDSTAAGPQWAWMTYHATPALRTLAEYQVGSGLLVPGYFDWARHLLAVVAERRPRLVIYMGSANDGQALYLGGAVRSVGSPAWRAAYGARVGAVMASLVREGTKVLWIGEPAMQDALLSAEMRAIDEVCAAEAARRPGVVFFNPGTVLDGPGGRYAGTLVIGGKRTAVRLDGIHLDIAGSIYLATFITTYVARMLGGTR